MRLKTILFALCSLIITSGTAQNLTLAKAFYKKAQHEYSNKNYDQVFMLLDKTKEYLGGETNPEITYLEGKTRYSSDINITQAKELLIQYLEEADPNDSRIDEVSSLIVELEINDKIDTEGNFKDVTGRSGIKTSYYDTGEIEWVEEFVKGVKNGFIKRYNKNGILIQSGTQKNGYVTGYYERFYDSGFLWRTYYLDPYGKQIKEERNYADKDGGLISTFTYANDKKHGPYKSYFILNGTPSKTVLYEGTYEQGKLKGRHTSYFRHNGKIMATCIYDNTPWNDLKIPSYIEGPKTTYVSNGTIYTEENYVKGKLQGSQKYYYINGNLKRWEHINENGKYQGERAYYYESSGKKAINIAYENGRALEVLEQVDVNGDNLKISKLKKGNGYIKRINDKGVLLYEANIVDGYVNGIVKKYHDNGKLREEYRSNLGNPFGRSKLYYGDGSLQSIYDYDLKKSIYAYSRKDQENQLIKMVTDNKTIEDMISYCKSKNPVGQDFYLPELAINDALGYELMNNNRVEDALKIFELNISFYPDGFNAYDSYGECLVKLGRKEDGIGAYKKSLELNPKNESAIKALKELTK